jgi:dihydropyrimidinase
MAYDKIITGGTVVTPDGEQTVDVAIAGEKIVAIAAGLAADPAGAEVIDASGHIVFPGVLDVHVHLELPFCGTVSADDYRSGTRAAARGGVTTLIDFAIPYGDDTLHDAVDNWRAKAEGKALIDYAFHVCINNWDKQQSEVGPLIDEGIPTFKEFMIYESQGWMSDDRTIFNTLERMRDLGGMLMVHAESARVLDELISRYHTPEQMKAQGAHLHTLSRPDFIEAEAIQRAITWSEITGGPLFVVHMSTGKGADLVRDAQQRGVKVLAETCAQYLSLDDSVFAGKDGHLYATCPQVKTAADSARLWQGLKTGEISNISTDTCTFSREQKAMWDGDFTKIPMGMPGLETLLPVCYTDGVLGGRLSLVELANVLAGNPADVMGLAPRKGAITVGADADLAIFHPDSTLTVDPAQMETNCDWNPYGGRKLAGFSRTTLSRGEIVVDDYKVVGNEGRGQWLSRKSAGGNDD